MLRGIKKVKASLILGFLITMLSLLHVKLYVPSTLPRMPIQMTCRGYPFPWIVGAGNPGEEPLIWSFQWLNLGFDLAIWTFFAFVLQLIKESLRGA